jgi:SAM-dependent methyltransferase
MNYYRKNPKIYYEQTASVDPSSFLQPLAECLTPPARIIDVGCGSGRDLLWSRQKGYETIGFENSSGLAELARSHSNCPIIEGDFEIFDFSTLSADAILLVGALVHLPHNRMPEIFGRIARVLSPGGKVLISMKEGEGEFTDDHGRRFFLWRKSDLEVQFQSLGFGVLRFFQQISKIRSDDVWLGYVLEKIA